MPTPGAVWYRAGRDSWFTTISGQQVSLGVKGVNNREAAEEIRAARLAVRKAASPGASQPTKQSRPSSVRPAATRIRDLVPRYVDQVVLQHAAVTQNSYHSRLRWIIAHFGDRQPEEVTAEEIERKVHKQPWNGNTRRHFLLVVKHFLRWAGRKDFHLRKPPPESRGDEAVIRPEQFEHLVGYARGDFAPYLRFLWLTECRPGEAYSLTCELEDWVNGTAVLRKHKTAHKGKRWVIYLSRESLTLLETQRSKYGGCGHLFRRRANRPFSPINVADRFRRAAKLSGVPRTAYCFRHTYITRMFESGTSDSDVASLVGGLRDERDSPLLQPCHGECPSASRGG